MAVRVFSDREVREFLDQQNAPMRLNEIEKRLQIPPRHTVLRVNNITISTKDAVEKAEKALAEIAKPNHFRVYVHPKISEAIILESLHQENDIQISRDSKEIIVDKFCGAAVLRGADIFAVGVLRAPSHLSRNDKVAVYVDLESQCLKGTTKEFKGPKLFVGNGTSVKSRAEIFKTDKPTGVAIKMTQTSSGCPSMNDLELTGDFMLQNLPSILVGRVLAPNPGDFVLDMCAAPGGKTLHLADLVGPSGLVFALDKSQPKIDQIQSNAMGMKAQNVRAFVMDGRKAVEQVPLETKMNLHSNSTPPFAPGSFQKVLLDAPCSALGQRPQFMNPMRLKELHSYPKLQKQLFHSAYQLLSPQGHLVYSTCTFNVNENEEMVAWALANFPDLRLVPSQVTLGRPGRPVDGLRPEDLNLMQRFDMDYSGDCDQDTIGFFIAKFAKMPEE